MWKVASGCRFEVRRWAATSVLFMPHCSGSWKGGMWPTVGKWQWEVWARRQQTARRHERGPEAGGERVKIAEGKVVPDPRFWPI